MVHRTWIKMCGLCRLEDALACAEAGVDAVGMVFAESPRRIDADRARAIVAHLPAHVLRFGVFVDETPAEIARILQVVELDRIQLHGFQEPTLHEVAGTRVVRGFRARDASVLAEIEAWSQPFFLLDSWQEDRVGGTGRTFDWDLARRAGRLGQLVLAGGLTPDNVGDAIGRVRPFGVDVSTGIESSPGVKDAGRIRAFVDAVREADTALAGRAGATH